MTRAILLTGTIDPAAFCNTNVKLTDTTQRLAQYEKAIYFYIQETELEKVIFVENSGYPFDAEKYEDMAKSLGKAFEFISIHTDLRQTVTKGKSYGEADCIEQGIRKSELLKGERAVYKVTGRVIVRNISKLLDQDDISKFVFRNDLHKCYTVFFKVNIADFAKYFSDAKKKCDEGHNIDIETVYYDILKDIKVNTGSFRRYPEYDGIIGTIGVAYNDPKFALVVKNLCLKLGLFTLDGNGRLLDYIAKIRVKQAKCRGER